jgi:hypothetical protein
MSLTGPLANSPPPVDIWRMPSLFVSAKAASAAAAVLLEVTLIEAIA